MRGHTGIDCLSSCTVAADSEADIQSLIERTEKEGDQLEQSGQNQPSAFSFAKVWAADKEALTEMDDVTSERAGEVGDSWAQVLAKLEAERGKVRAQEVTGRGARRKAAPSFLPEVSAYFCIVGSELTSSLAELGRRYWI